MTNARPKQFALFVALGALSILADVAFLTSFGIALAGCATTKTAATACAVIAAPDVIAAVEPVLAEPGETAYLDDLQALATKFGMCLLDAAVADVIARSQPTGASADPVAALKVQRGRAWLVAHPPN